MSNLFRLVGFILLLNGLPSAQAVTNCTEVTQIPVVECEALLDLYNSTDGPNWIDNTGWNETNIPCDWEGVTCSGGYVTKLDLSHNQLSQVAR